jgi:glucokinase
MSSSTERFAIGIDIGATKIASVLLSQHGELVDSSQVLTLAQEGPQAVFDRVAEQVLHLARQKPGAVVGVGIGSPGKVDSDHGIVYDAVNLGWKEVRLDEEITNRTGQSLPIWIQKDTNLNALGE